MSKASEFLKGTREEMKHVTWPTRKQTINHTLLVIGISIVVALLLGLFDYLFSLGLGVLLAS